MNVESYIEEMTALGYRLAVIVDATGKPAGIQTSFPDSEPDAAHERMLNAQAWWHENCTTAELASALVARKMVIVGSLP